MTEIERLLRRKKEAEGRAAASKAAIAEASFELARAKKDVQEIARQIALEKEAEKVQKNGSEVTVSDHCIIRYLERKHGFSFDSVRDEIKEICSMGALAGANTVTYNGARFVISNGTVITVT